MNKYFQKAWGNDIRKFILCVCLIFANINSFFAQQPFIEVDNLSNVYTVKGHELKKFKPGGNLSHTFSHKNAGHITSVDVTNPLRILVFFRDMGQVIFLDNTLSVTQGPITLQSHNIFDPQLVCASADGGFWVFDRLNTALYKLNNKLQQEHSLPNISQIVGANILPTAMRKSGKKLYVNVPDIGLLVFDMFGNYVNTLHFKGISDFNVLGEKLYYYDRDKVGIFNLSTLTEEIIELPDIPFSAMAFSSSFICLWDKRMEAFHRKYLE